MAWWMWLLIGIGGYIVIGMAVGAVASYVDGRRYPGGNFDDELVLMASGFWPVAIVVGIFMGVAHLGTRFHEYGSTHDERKKQSQQKKDYEKMLNDFAKENGIDPKTLRKTAAQSPVG